MQKAYLGIDDRCVEYYWSGEYFVVKDGFQLEVRQRIIHIVGVDELQEHVIRGGKKKVVYLPYRKKSSINCSNVKNVSEITSHIAHAKYIRTSIGDYIVIITSGAFMVDYIVISEDKIAIVVPGKREIYIDRENGSATLYIV